MKNKKYRTGENMTDEELRAMIDEFDRDGDGESKFMCIDIYKQAIFLCVRYFGIVFPF
jgi:Ca2+-binding EF-hand superfamily protein